MSDQTLYKGIEMDTNLLDAANSMIDGRGDGRISMADAKKLLSLINEDQVATNTEKATFAYILEHFNWTDAARRLVEENDALQLSTFDPTEETSTESTPIPVQQQFHHDLFGKLHITGYALEDDINISVTLLSDYLGNMHLSNAQSSGSIIGNSADYTAHVVGTHMHSINSVRIHAVIFSPSTEAQEDDIIWSW